MHIGTVLSDRETGLKLMVVEEPIANDSMTVSLNGRCLTEECVVPASPIIGGKLTTDPGMRG